MIKFAEFVDIQNDLAGEIFGKCAESVARSPHFLCFWRSLAMNLESKHEVFHWLPSHFGRFFRIKNGNFRGRDGMKMTRELGLKELVTPLPMTLQQVLTSRYANIDRDRR